MTGYFLACQQRPAFVLRTFPNGCREVSHPTRPTEWGSGPEHHHRLIAPWFEDCPNPRCSQGCVVQFPFGGGLRCDSCWERYRAYKWQLYPTLATLFLRYCEVYKTLFYASDGRPTRACPWERLLFYHGQSEDYRMCCEAIAEAVLADTVEELAPRFACNLQRFRALIATSPAELCYYPEARLATLETMLAEVTAACEAELAAQVTRFLTAQLAVPPGSAAT